MKQTVFIDIDGTLTEDGSKKWGKPILHRIENVKKLAKDLRNRVVLWSGNGEEYVQEFAIKYKIEPIVFIGKPTLIIDDNPQIRPVWENIKRDPTYLD